MAYSSSNPLSERKQLPRFSAAEFAEFMRKEAQYRIDQAWLMEEMRRLKIEEKAEERQRRRPKKTIDWSKRVILADLSGSMYAEAHDGRTCYDNMYDTIRNILSKQPMQLVAYAEIARRCTDVDHMHRMWNSRELNPGINNELAALEMAKTLKPELTLLISDGGAGSPSEVLSYATRYPGKIDTLYIGPSGNHHDIAFLQELARIGGGQCALNDLSQIDQAELEESMESLILREL